MPRAPSAPRPRTRRRGPAAAARSRPLLAECGESARPGRGRAGRGTGSPHPPQTPAGCLFAVRRRGVRAAPPRRLVPRFPLAHSVHHHRVCPGRPGHFVDQLAPAFVGWVWTQPTTSCLNLFRKSLVQESGHAVPRSAWLIGSCHRAVASNEIGTVHRKTGARRFHTRHGIVELPPESCGGPGGLRLAICTNPHVAPVAGPTRPTIK